MRRLWLSLLACLMVLAGVATPAGADVDVYTTPGEHLSGGREWRTWCESYSQTARCTTQIKSGGKWVFNNLTYLPSPRQLWAGNPLATPGEHTVAGRLWQTECDTPRTGRGGCRSYIWDGKRFVFNNIVHFGTLRTDLDSLYEYRPGTSPAPAPDRPPASGYEALRRGANNTNKVMLTYDDCPKSLADFRTAVKAASDLGVRLALFPTGNCFIAGRFDTNYALSMGHYVFNHSITHPSLDKLSYTAVVKELGAPGVVTTWGRPPFGAYNDTVRRAYASVGMGMWLWHVDTNDWQGKSSAELIRYTVNTAKAGDTVLLHMQWNGFNGSTIKAIRDGLNAKGIGVCANTGPVEAKPAKAVC